MKQKASKLGVILMLAGGMAWAQQPPPGPGAPAPPPPPAQPLPPQPAPQPARLGQGPRPMRGPGRGLGMPFPAGQPAMSELMAGRPGRWWNNPDMAQKLGLSADQVKRMDDIFQQSRLQLIDLNANLQKQELVLEPLVSADQPDEPKILGQIDKVVQARAELEKANARMLLGVRRVLSQEQWQKLKADTPKPRAAEPGEPAPPPKR